MGMPAFTALLVSLSSRVVAIPASVVSEIVLLPRLVQRVGMPPFIRGVMNLRGEAVPVLRLDALLELPPVRIGVFSVVVVVGASGHAPWAFVAERAVDVVALDGVAPVPEEYSYNGCAVGMITMVGGGVPLLDPDRVLSLEERQALDWSRQLLERRLAGLAPERE